MNISEGLHAVFWQGQMKYITVGQAVVVGLALLLYTVTTPFIGMVVAFGGLLSIQFCAHTYWMYQSMRDDEDFDHNPLYGAIFGVAMMYALALVGAVVVLGVLIAASAYTGLPLVLPGLAALALGWVVYYLL